MNAPHEASATQAADTPSPFLGGGPGARALADRLGLLAEAGRLDNIADLLSLASDLVDLLDQSMVEKLALLSEQASSAAWTAANTLRDAHARTLQEARPPSLTGLIGLLRDEDTRRGMAVALRALQTLGRQMAAQRKDYADVS